MTMKPFLRMVPASNEIRETSMDATPGNCNAERCLGGRPNNATTSARDTLTSSYCHQPACWGYVLLQAGKRRRDWSVCWDFGMHHPSTHSPARLAGANFCAHSIPRPPGPTSFITVPSPGTGIGGLEVHVVVFLICHFSGGQSAAQAREEGRG